jgi:hypothetical protein
MLSLSFFGGGELLLNSSDADEKGELQNYEAGIYKTRIHIKAPLFNSGYYYMEVSLKLPGIEWLDRKQNIPFEIVHTENALAALYQNYIPGKVVIPLKYETAIQHHHHEKN